MWLVLVLAAINAVLTVLTINAGKWLEHKIGRTPAIHIHAEVGDTMVYFSAALAVAAVLLAVVHLQEQRGRSVKPVARWLLTAVVILASVAATIQIYRIGDAGARATWGAEFPPSNRTDT